MNSIYCEACNQHIESHRFEGHLKGKKHKQNINGFTFIFKPLLKEWQKQHTKRIEDASDNLKSLSTDANLCYSQICLICLVEVDASASKWYEHANGKLHQRLFLMSPRMAKQTKSIEIPDIHTKDYFQAMCSYGSGQKALIIGEVDFTYALSAIDVLNNGGKLVATSYLSLSGNSKQKDLTDYEKSCFYSYKLSSISSGKLHENLKLLTSSGADIAFRIDAGNLFNSLSREKVYTGPFDFIIFPFPRAVVKKGIDVRNGILIKSFFEELQKNKHQLAHNGTQIHMLLLRNQITQWDIAKIGILNGWKLTKVVSANLKKISKYICRDGIGNQWFPKKSVLAVFTMESQ